MIFCYRLKKTNICNYADDTTIHTCDNFLCYFIFSVELEKYENIKIIQCETHKEIRCSGKLISWPWKIKCGICATNSQLSFDADIHGRISSFEWRKSLVSSVIFLNTMWVNPCQVINFFHFL